MRKCDLGAVIFIVALAFGVLQTYASACEGARVRLAEATDLFERTGQGEQELLVVATELKRCESAPPIERLVGFEWVRWILAQEGRTEEVLSAGEYALAHFATLLPPEEQVHILHRYAEDLRRAGRVSEAILPYLDALRLAEVLPVEGRANLMLGLSAHYASLGEYQRALEIAAEVEGLAGADHALVSARAMARQANVISLLSNRGEADEQVLEWGLAQADHARDILQGENGGASRVGHMSFVEVTRSRLLIELQRYDEASEAANKAVEMARSMSDRILMQRLVTKGEIELISGEHRRAEETLREALGLVDKQIGWAGRVHLLMGRTQRALGDTARAVSHLQQAIDHVEAEREYLGTSEWALLRLTLHDSAYRDYASLLLSQGRTREAFDWIDAERARYLRDVRHLRATRRDGDALAELHANLREVEDAIRSASPPSGQLLARRARLQAEIARQSGRTAGNVAIDLPELQRRLEVDGRVLISYFLDEPSHAFVVTAHEFHAIPLDATWEMVREQVVALDLPDSPEELHRRGPAIRPEPLKRLYDLLFAPVEVYVPEGVPVTVIPDRQSGEIPFAMLISDDAQPYAYDQWPYLIYRNPFSMELSAALLLEDRKADLGRWPVVAFGRTGFDDVDILEGGILTPLPQVSEELRAIRRQVSGAIVALDRRATERDLYQVLPDTRILHLASHAFVSHEAPLYSAVVLTADASGTGSESDGTLYLYELLGRQMDAALVVLSGCSTARGQARLSEGVIGLHYGFRAAGAQASIATMWPVEDRAIAAIMGSLYGHLARGTPTDEALRQAQLAYLASADRSRANPFYWAAPVLAGNPGPIDLGRNSLPQTAWWSVGLLFLLLGTALSRLQFARRDG